MLNFMATTMMAPLKMSPIFLALWTFVAADPLPVAQVQKIKAVLEDGTLLSAARFDFGQTEASVEVKQADTGKITLTLTTVCELCEFKPEKETQKYKYKGVVQMAMGITLVATNTGSVDVGIDKKNVKLMAPGKLAKNGLESEKLNLGKWETLILSENSEVIASSLRRYKEKEWPSAAQAQRLKQALESGAIFSRIQLKYGQTHPVVVVDKVEDGKVVLTLSTKCEAECTFAVSKGIVSPVVLKGNIKMVLAFRLEAAIDKRAVSATVLENELKLLDPDLKSVGDSFWDRFTVQKRRKIVLAANAEVYRRALSTEMEGLSDRVREAGSTKLAKAKSNEFGALLDGKLAKLEIRSSTQYQEYADFTEVFVKFCGSLVGDFELDSESLKAGQQLEIDLYVNLLSIRQPWEEKAKAEAWIDNVDSVVKGCGDSREAFSTSVKSKLRRAMLADVQQNIIPVIARKFFE